MWCGAHMFNLRQLQQKAAVLVPKTATLTWGSSALVTEIISVTYSRLTLLNAVLPPENYDIFKTKMGSVIPMARAQQFGSASDGKG
jgi:hypothetical protein